MLRDHRGRTLSLFSGKMRENPQRMVLTEENKCSSAAEKGEDGGGNRQRNRKWNGTEEGGARALGELERQREDRLRGASLCQSPTGGHQLILTELIPS